MPGKETTPPCLICNLKVQNLRMQHVNFRNPSQRSSPVRLIKGRVYYMEVLMKEGGGGDHLSVGVKWPHSKRIRPVSRKNLYQRPPGEMVISSKWKLIPFSFWEGVQLML